MLAPKLDPSKRIRVNVDLYPDTLHPALRSRGAVTTVMQSLFRDITTVAYSEGCTTADQIAARLTVVSATELSAIRQLSQTAVSEMVTMRNKYDQLRADTKALITYLGKPNKLPELQALVKEIKQHH